MPAEAETAQGCALRPLTRVQLQGLSWPELNGKIAVVLAPDDAAESRQFEKSGRVKVSSYPKPLSLKPENLVAAPPPKFATPQLPFTLLQIARRDATVSRFCEAAAAQEGQRLGLERIGDFDEPLDLVEALWQCHGAIPPAEPFPEDLVCRIADTSGHWLYWLGLEQVGHHLLLEACDGVWRGYQCFPRRGSRGGEAAQTFGESGGILVESNLKESRKGYTAREWLAAPIEHERIAHVVDPDLVEELLGVCWVFDDGYYEVVRQGNDSFLFRVARSKQLWVLEGPLREGDSDWLLADVESTEQVEQVDLHAGTYRFKLVDDILKVNFMKAGSRSWDSAEVAISLASLETQVSESRQHAAELDSLAEAARAKIAEAEAEVEAEAEAKAAEQRANDAFSRRIELEQRLVAARETASVARSVEPAAPSSTTETEARELWGGGRDLDRNQVTDVLKMVLQLKAQAQAIAGKLREQAPRGTDAAVAAWASTLLGASDGGASLSVIPSRPSSPRPGAGQGETKDVWIFSPDDAAEPRCDLNVKCESAYPFMQTFARLTGEYPRGAHFLRLLELAGWKDLERDDGGSCGWTLRSLDLRRARDRRTEDDKT